MPIVTPRELLEVGAHFGHQTHRWKPKMARYHLWGKERDLYY
jgi:small subunit ribosomal protein S2